METCVIIEEFRHSSLLYELDSSSSFKEKGLDLSSSSLNENGIIKKEQLLEHLALYRNEFKMSATCPTMPTASLRDEVLNFWEESTNCWRGNKVLRWKLSNRDSAFGRILQIQNKNVDSHCSCAAEPP